MLSFPLDKLISMEDELRKKAISRYIKGESPKIICADLNRSKHWFFKWLNRFKSGGSDWFKDKPKAPLKRPNEASEVIEQLIVSTRTRLELEPFAQVGVPVIK